MSIVSFTFYNFIIARQLRALGSHDQPLNCLSIYKKSAIYFIEFLGFLFPEIPFPLVGSSPNVVLVVQSFQSLTLSFITITWQRFIVDTYSDIYLHCEL